MSSSASTNSSASSSADSSADLSASSAKTSVSGYAALSASQEHIDSSPQSVKYAGLKELFADGNYGVDIHDMIGEYNDYDKLLEKKTYFKYDSECLRKKSNWSKVRNEFKFDDVSFSPEDLSSAIHTHSAKLEDLLKRIADLDKKDMEKDGRKYKHFIFSDLKTGLYGAKLIAGALMAKGMKLGYGAELLKNPKGKKIYGKIELKTEEELLKTKYNNFYLLSSVAVYDQPISVVTKKSILRTFNQRPDNVYGELARIIVMDSGYKEGIDLFDVKYVHIYEPQITVADQKQVIGRGTRTCGQKGLDFHPTKGWPLYVYIYDVSIPQEMRKQMLNSSTLFDLYMKSMNIDFRLFNFQHDLERATVFGSVDYELNRDIHNFAIEPDHDDMMFGGAPKKIVVNARAPKLILGQNFDQPMTFEQTREFVRRYYSEYAWKDIRMENNCVDKKAGGATILNYTPTQDFVRNYFTPRNPVKGMYLWHSVGTGKTCSAIAAATSSFEAEGYTILWVTRTTLKNDIWKNMFDQVCNESIRDKIEDGQQIPNEQNKRMRLLSKSWSIRPMSYKQFSNLVSKKNSFYDALVKKNGEADPLHKTLLIIDEAHKLYGGEDLSSLERPDMDALKAALQNSYMVSGKDSVRLLLMTATPITGNPMELVKLINLLKPLDKHMPEQFQEFSDKYLNEEGRFTVRGEREYLDDIAGYVSYLNREKDARQFSQPIVKFVNSPLVDDVKEAMKLDKRLFREKMIENINNLKEQVAENTKLINKEVKTLTAKKLKHLKEKCSHFDGKTKKACEKMVRGHISAIVRDVKDSIKPIKERIKEIRESIREHSDLKLKTLYEMKKDVSPETIRKQMELKNSMYYQVYNKCSKKITDTPLLKDAVKLVPEIAMIDKYIEILDEKINKLNQDLEIVINAYKNKILQIKELIKDKNTTADERNLLRNVIKEQQKEHKKNVHNLTVIVSDKVNAIEKRKRKTMKIRRKAITSVKKDIKELRKMEKLEKREIEKQRRAEEKIIQAQEGYIHEFESDYLKDMINKHSEEIDVEINKVNEDLKTYENEVRMKELAKEEKRIAKETKKKQKALEAAHKKTVKNQKEAEKREKAAAKEAEKQHKVDDKRQKEAAKEAEKRAKEQQRVVKEHEKREKAVAKEVAKAQKEQAAATRKLQAEQKKLNKTAKAQSKK